MKKFLFAAVVALAVGLWGMSSLNAQEGKKDGGHAGHDHAGHDHKGQEGQAHGDMADMAPVTPSVEHHRLQQSVGTWKHETKMWMPESPEPMIATGTATVKAVLGGLAITEEYNSKSEMGDFSGYSLTTWNIDKKQYECFWVDTMSRYGTTQLTGTFDEKTNQFNLSGMSMCHGENTKMRTVHRIESKDKHVFEMYMTGPDGKEAKGMEITYTRAK